MENSQMLLQKIKRITAEYESLQADIRTLEDIIAEDELSVRLLENGSRDSWLHLRDSYRRRMSHNLRRLAVLQEELTANRMEYNHIQMQLDNIQSRLQAAE